MSIKELLGGGFEFHYDEIKFNPVTGCVTFMYKTEELISMTVNGYQQGLTISLINLEGTLKVTENV